MKFITVRDLRSRSADVWRKLSEEGDLVVTSHGKPIAIISATDEERLEQALRERRQVRALHAVKQLQEAAAAAGRDKLTDEAIDTEIRQARRGRRP